MRGSRCARRASHPCRTQMTIVCLKSRHGHGSVWRAVLQE